MQKMKGILNVNQFIKLLLHTSTPLQRSNDTIFECLFRIKIQFICKIMCFSLWCCMNGKRRARFHWFLSAFKHFCQHFFIIYPEQLRSGIITESAKFYFRYNLMLVSEPNTSNAKAKNNTKFLKLRTDGTFSVAENDGQLCCDFYCLACGEYRITNIEIAA